MFTIFTAPRGDTQPGVVLTVEAVGQGIEDLLVAWLEELLFQSEVKGLALHDFSVLELSDGHVRGEARGVKFGRGADTTGPAVKAVTRHGLEVSHANGQWLARVLFDV